MIWLAIAVIIVGYFVVKVIQRNMQVKVAIASQNAMQNLNNSFIDTSHFKQLPAAVIQPSRAPILNNSIVKYAPIMGEWVVSLQSECDDMIQELTFDGTDFLYNYRWEFYCETLFYAAAYITHNLRKKLTKNERSYMFIVLCGEALSEEPNIKLFPAKTTTQHIKTLLEESDFAKRIKEYLGSDTPAEIYKRALKTNLIGVSDNNLEKYLTNLHSSVDQIGFDSLLEPQHP